MKLPLTRVKSVLILDDDAAWLRCVGREIARAERDDLHAFFATSPSEAYRVAEQHQLDLAIVDLHLRYEVEDGYQCSSGISVVEGLKRIQPGVIAVLTSAYLTTKDVDLARDAGASFSDPKPVAVMQIVARIEGMLLSAPLSFECITLARAEWEHIHRVLADSGNNVSEAARRLGVQRSVLQRKLRRLAPLPHAPRLR